MRISNRIKFRNLGAAAAASDKMLLLAARTSLSSKTERVKVA
jgi:hypothetical protein